MSRSIAYARLPSVMQRMVKQRCVRYTVELVRTIDEIEDNLCRLVAYLDSADPEDHRFAQSLIRRGHCFVVANWGDGLFFAPSRFIGYRGNTRATHQAAGNDHHGGKTDQAVTGILGELAQGEELEAAYQQFCERIGVEPTGIRRKYWAARTLVPGAVRLAEEVAASDELFEGTVCQVIINAYERNWKARHRCIAHYGPTCMVCGFDFGAVYGPLAAGFIHVHHVKPLSEIGEEYEVDPVADLRPICPNCHAVIHMGGACRGIEEVRRLLQPKEP